MSKQKAVLIGCDFSELGWLSVHFLPHIVWKKFVQYKDQNIKFIVCCRDDRQDLFGFADEFESLIIEGEGTKYLARGFVLGGLSEEDHHKLIREFYIKYSEKYDIVEHIYKLSEYNFPEDKMLYEFHTRSQNLDLLKTQDFFSNEKEIISIAPRTRIGDGLANRNWNYWKQLYDMILKDRELQSKYNFVLIGKDPDYIKDYRFYDLNNIKIEKKTSLVGLTIETMKMSKLIIGSESSIPLMACIMNLPLLMWGSAKVFLRDNGFLRFFKGDQTFIDSPKFDVKPEIIFEKIKEILENKKRGVPSIPPQSTWF